MNYKTINDDFFWMQKAIKLAKQAEGVGHSAFTWFVTQALDDKDPVIKKFFNP